MEPIKKQMRMVLILGKYPISLKVGNKIKVELGGSTTMAFEVPDIVDVRVGDLLTFYTEVLMKDPTDAITITTPIQ
jgi:hypothetical protein